MNIKHFRVSKKLTQEQLASAVNVKRTTVAMWENGESNPRADLIPKIAKTLGCSVADLFENKKETASAVSDTCENFK